MALVEGTCYVVKESAKWNNVLGIIAILERECESVRHSPSNAAFRQRGLYVNSRTAAIYIYIYIYIC